MITCGSVRKKSEPDFGPVISNSHYNFLKKLQKKSLKKGYLICKSNSRNDAKNLFPLNLSYEIKNYNINKRIIFTLLHQDWYNFIM